MQKGCQAWYVLTDTQHNNISDLFTDIKLHRKPLQNTAKYEVQKGSLQTAY